MKCPHCLENFHDEWQEVELTYDELGSWRAEHTKCPACSRLIVKLRLIPMGTMVLTQSQVVLPRSLSRAPLPKEVPPQFAQDYKESSAVLGDSPKASAALSRRCLQDVLRDHFNVKPGNLSNEIDQVLPLLPSHLAVAIDGIRNLGNFAAHPMKSTNTREILDVEPGEAEWCLEVLESLFDFCFVQPARLQSRRQALNAKLAKAGKPKMK